MPVTSVTPEPQREAMLSATLSREELEVLMHLLHFSQMPGVDRTWLNPRPDGTYPSATTVALDTAARDLQARNLLVLEAGDQTGAPLTPRVPSALIALVGACVQGDLAIWFSATTIAGPRRAYYHRFRGVYVEHIVSPSGLHQFTGVDSPAIIIQTLAGLMAVAQQPAAPVPPGSVAAVQLTAAREQALQGNIPAAITRLVLGGLPQPTAEALSAAMAQATSMGSIMQSTSNAQGQVTSRSAAYVVTPQACFLLEDPNDGRTIAVSALSGAMLGQWVANLFA